MWLQLLKDYQIAPPGKDIPMSPPLQTIKRRVTFHYIYRRVQEAPEIGCTRLVDQRRCNKKKLHLFQCAPRATKKVIPFLLFWAEILGCCNLLAVGISFEFDDCGYKRKENKQIETMAVWAVCLVPFHCK